MSYIVTLILLAVIVVSIIVIILIVKKPIGGRSKAIGEDCTFHTDCTGNTPVMQAGTCCNAATKKCEEKVKDFRGNYYCADVAIIGKSEGEPCTKAEDCQGVGIGLEPGTYCCDGVCKQKVQDRAGGYWCPGEAITGEIGSRCIVHTDCKGNTVAGQAGTCCNAKTKKCEQKVKDMAGNYYCPDIARRCPPGFTDYFGGLCYTDNCKNDGGTRTAAFSCDFGSQIQVSPIDCGRIGPLADGAPCTHLGAGWFKTTACNCQKGGLITNAARYGQTGEPIVGTQ